ncbi:MAG: DUF1493 family protein [Piscirickettsiaceae bacterium]|nr:DUF1493 family protein [Piscirickettsiaceae bacterium]
MATLYIIEMIESELIKLISEESGVPISKISGESTLLGDLGLDGDDAWELFDKCHEKYGLDLTNFYFKKHFRNEPCSKGLIYLFRKVKYRDEHLAANKEPIAVSKLVAACKVGAW